MEVLMRGHKFRLNAAVLRALASAGTVTAVTAVATIVGAGRKF